MNNSRQSIAVAATPVADQINGGTVIDSRDIPTNVENNFIPVTLVQISAIQYEVRIGPVVAYREAVSVMATQKFAELCCALKNAVERP